MLKRVWAICLVTMLAGIAGCNKSESQSTTQPSAGASGSGGAVKPAGAHLSIAVIPKGTTHVFWQSVHAGANRAAREIGNVDIRWQGPQGEAERGAQIRIVDDLLTQGVDAVVMAPIDSSALVDTINETAKKVPVVIFDSGANTDKYTAFVATDNYKGGQLAGKRMVELLGSEGGELAIVRTMAGSESTTQREEGFKSEIAKNTNIKLVAEPYGDSDRAKSQRVAGDILAAHPNIKGMYGPNESSAFGILGALHDYNKKPGEIKFVGFDASDDLNRGMDEGFIDSLVLQNPVLMGHNSVLAAVAALHGEKVEKNQPIEPVLATHDNMNDPKIKDLMHPNLSDAK
jgi:ribose transport system substrate-binding protein